MRGSAHSRSLLKPVKLMTSYQLMEMKKSRVVWYPIVPEGAVTTSSVPGVMTGLLDPAAPLFRVANSTVSGVTSGLLNPAPPPFRLE